MNKGKIVQIIGPVVDVDFGEENSLPPIYNALKIKLGKGEIVAEVVKHLEPGKVRAISMAPTDGLNRGAGVERMVFQSHEIHDSRFYGQGRQDKDVKEPHHGVG